jgi:hypothetical protein
MSSAKPNLPTPCAGHAHSCNHMTISKTQQCQRSDQSVMHLFGSVARQSKHMQSILQPNKAPTIDSFLLKQFKLNVMWRMDRGMLGTQRMSLSELRDLIPPLSFGCCCGALNNALLTWQTVGGQNEPILVVLLWVISALGQFL